MKKTVVETLGLSRAIKVRELVFRDEVTSASLMHRKDNEMEIWELAEKETNRLMADMEAMTERYGRSLSRQVDLKPVK